MRDAGQLENEMSRLDEEKKAYVVLQMVNFHFPEIVLNWSG